MKRDIFDVAIIGNVGIDTNVYFSSNEPDFEAESNFTENIDYIGQAGGYTARAFAQLKHKTAFIGYVGNDANGQFIRDEFSAEQIDTTAVFIDQTGTSRSINFMFADGRRKNFYDGKNHMQLVPELAICRKIIEKSKLVHFHIPNWARTLLPVAKDSGAVISCDIQDVSMVCDPYRLDFINYADFLFFSSVNHEDPAPLFAHFSSLNPTQTQICGMGARGCAACRKGEITYFPSVELDTPVIDSNGAGDGLATGFLSSHILQREPFEDAILKGQITARNICTQKASSSNLITPELLAYWFKILKK